MASSSRASRALSLTAGASTSSIIEASLKSLSTSWTAAAAGLSAVGPSVSAPPPPSPPPPSPPGRSVTPSRCRPEISLIGTPAIESSLSSSDIKDAASCDREYLGSRLCSFACSLSISASTSSSSSGKSAAANSEYLTSPLSSWSSIFHTCLSFLVCRLMRSCVSARLNSLYEQTPSRLRSKPSKEASTSLTERPLRSRSRLISSAMSAIVRPSHAKLKLFPTMASGIAKTARPAIIAKPITTRPAPVWGEKSP